MSESVIYKKEMTSSLHLHVTYLKAKLTQTSRTNVAKNPEVNMTTFLPSFSTVTKPHLHHHVRPAPREPLIHTDTALSSHLEITCSFLWIHSGLGAPKRRDHVFYLFV